MEKSFKSDCSCKLNLFLDIISKRKDGYHNIKTIFQEIDLHDTIIIKKIPQKQILLNVHNPYRKIKTEDNIVYQTAKYLLSSKKSGVIIKLWKRVPISAGLGAGSSDCARTIEGINKLFNLKLTSDKKKEIALKFGSDVPFFLTGGCCKAEGRGEILTPIKNNLKLYFVLVNLGFEVPTKTAYQLISEKEFGAGNKYFKLLLKGIKENDFHVVCSNLYNIFEKPIFKKYPVLQRIKKMLIEQGADSALMSGSGPTIFGLFQLLQKAKICYNKIKNNYSFCAMAKSII